MYLRNSFVYMRHSDCELLLTSESRSNAKNNRSQRCKYETSYVDFKLLIRIAHMRSLIIILSLSILIVFCTNKLMTPAL